MSKKSSLGEYAQRFQSENWITKSVSRRNTFDGIVSSEYPMKNGANLAERTRGVYDLKTSSLTVYMAIVHVLWYDT